MGGELTRPYAVADYGSQHTSLLDHVGRAPYRSCDRREWEVNGMKEYEAPAVVVLGTVESMTQLDIMTSVTGNFSVSWSS